MREFNPPTAETKVEGNLLCSISEFKRYKKIRQDLAMSSLIDFMVDHILGLNIKVPEISLKANVSILCKSFSNLRNKSIPLSLSSKIKVGNFSSLDDEIILQNVSKLVEQLNIKEKSLEQELYKIPFDEEQIDGGKLNIVGHFLSVGLPDIRLATDVLQRARMLVCKRVLASRKKGKFTPEEDEIIFQFVMDNGRLWVDLSNNLGRDALSVRNRYEIFLIESPNCQVFKETDVKKRSELSAFLSESEAPTAHICMQSMDKTTSESSASILGSIPTASCGIQSQDSLGFISSKFSAPGLLRVWDWFSSRGHEVCILLPQSRIRKTSGEEKDILTELEKAGVLIYTSLGGPWDSYDDRYIVFKMADKEKSSKSSSSLSESAPPTAPHGIQSWGASCHIVLDSKNAGIIGELDMDSLTDVLVDHILKQNLKVHKLAIESNITLFSNGFISIARKDLPLDLSPEIKVGDFTVEDDDTILHNLRKLSCQLKWKEKDMIYTLLDITIRSGALDKRMNLVGYFLADGLLDVRLATDVLYRAKLLACKGFLSSCKDKGMFTTEEDRIILEFVNEKGKRWLTLSKLLARTAFRVRNRYEELKIQMVIKHRTPGPARMIVVDGNNVAMELGQGKFSAFGLLIVWDWFNSRGHEVLIFLPQSRFRRASDKDKDILSKLQEAGYLVYTPSRRTDGQTWDSYDDRYIVKYAVQEQGIIVSNDNFRDLIAENEEFRDQIEKRLLHFTFIKEEFSPPDDPLGMKGPSLTDFLRH